MFNSHCAVLALLPIALAVGPAAAAGYPQKPIRVLIPFAPGGGTDVLARGISDRLSEALGASVVIENRPGAGSTIGVGLVAQSAPDGYTLLLTSASYTFAPSLYKDLPYDPLRDLRPITMFASVPNLLVVHPSMPVRTVRVLVALARKHPDEILYASAGRGSNLHLTTELFNYLAGIRMKQVPYKGGGPSLIAIMSGEVHVNFPTIHSAFPHVKAGRMRAIAVSTLERASSMPELPTIDESGVPGYDKAGWFGMFVPAAVPEAIVSHVYQAVAKVLKDPAVTKRLAFEGATAVANPPAEFAAYVRSELELWAKLIRDMKL